MDPGTPVLRITVIGAGGTGCALLPMLMAMRPGALWIVDGDMVEERNLHRQTLYGPQDVGRSKAEAAMARIIHQDRGTQLDAIPRFIDARNVHELLTGSTVVADCTDDLHARMLLDRICGKLGIPLVSGAVHGQQIQVATLHQACSTAEHGTALRDWFPGGIGAEQDGCDMRDVPAAVTNLAAACMAMRIQAALAGDNSYSQYLDLIDPRNGSWMRIKAPAAPHDEELIAQGVPKTEAAQG